MCWSGCAMQAARCLCGVRAQEALTGLPVRTSTHLVACKGLDLLVRKASCIPEDLGIERKAPAPVNCEARAHRRKLVRAATGDGASQRGLPCYSGELRRLLRCWLGTSALLQGEGGSRPPLSSPFSSAMSCFCKNFAIFPFLKSRSSFGFSARQRSRVPGAGVHLVLCLLRGPTSTSALPCLASPTFQLFS